MYRPRRVSFLPSSRKRSTVEESIRREERREAYKKADEFKTELKRVRDGSLRSQGLLRLYAKSERARKLTSVLEHKISLLQSVLDAKEKYNHALKAAKTAEMESFTVDGPHTVPGSRRGRQTSSRVQEAPGSSARRIQRALIDQSRKLSTLEAAIRKVQEEHVDWFLKQFPNNLGIGQKATQADRKLDGKFIAFSRHACKVLNNKAYDHFSTVVALWHQAFEAQRRIERLYKRDRISELKRDVDNLDYRVREEVRKLDPDVNTINSTTENLRERIIPRFRALSLRDEERTSLREAETKLLRAMRSMENLRIRTEQNKSPGQRQYAAKA